MKPVGAPTLPQLIEAARREKTPEAFRDWLLGVEQGISVEPKPRQTRLL